VRSHHSRFSSSRSDVSREGASTAVRLFDGASIYAAAAAALRTNSLRKRPV
jgi:hypothetical protein